MTLSMNPTKIRQPIPITPAVTQYDKALKLRISLLIAALVFSTMVLFCCPVFVWIQMSNSNPDPIKPSAGLNQPNPVTATKVIDPERTPKPIGPTRTPQPALATATLRPTRTPTSLSYPVAVISCANKIYKVNLRRTPGYKNKDEATDSIYEIPCGESVELLGDKKEVDQLTWWKIRWNDYTGWVADHTASGKTILIFNP
jgi:hypothetical protein